MQHSTVPVLELTWIEMPQYIIINKQYNPQIMHGRLKKKKKTLKVVLKKLKERWGKKLK